MTDRQTDGQTDARGKTICLLTLKGGDIISNHDTFLSLKIVFSTVNNTEPYEMSHFLKYLLKTYAAISNAHLSRVCKRGKLSGSCLSTLNGFESTQLLIFLCYIGVPTFSSQNN